MRERCDKCGQTLNPWRVRVKSKLTARQWEYIECFISGLSRKQTAEKLFVCEKAVAWQPHIGQLEREVLSFEIAEIASQLNDSSHQAPSQDP